MLMITKRLQHGLTVLVLENASIRTELVPALGGKFISVYNKRREREFLWHNEALQLEKLAPGADYDSNFWGGIDELLPNDIPEEVDGVAYPDHGELWTTALDHQVAGDGVVLSGLLPKSKLFYQKSVRLATDSPEIIVEYHINNRASESRHFLWKLHAALQIESGDRLVTSAEKARGVYPDASRFADSGEFSWSRLGGVDAAVVPAKNGTMDFFYLYDAPKGEMAMVSDGGERCFSYTYDKAVFPYQWYFASYGQFRDHYTAILEPASAMPVSVNEAAALGQCSVLKPGEAIQTRVTIYAGENVEPTKSES